MHQVVHKYQDTGSRASTLRNKKPRSSTNPPRAHGIFPSEEAFGSSADGASGLLAGAHLSLPRATLAVLDRKALLSLPAPESGVLPTAQVPFLMSFSLNPSKGILNRTTGAKPSVSSLT